MHGLVLLGHVLLQMHVALFDFRQSFGFVHRKDCTTIPGRTPSYSLKSTQSGRSCRSTMKMRPFSLFAALVVGLSLVVCSALATPPDSGPLILVSIDGFRWDYLTKFSAPTLRQLADDGVHATRLISSFPTKTFPNHYS